MGDDLTRFKKLDFEGFRKLAQDDALTPYEKIGFPRSYREGRETAIFEDILRKLPNLGVPNQTVVDIGPGCSGLPYMLIELCRERSHQLVLIDSPEMLRQLPDEPFIRKIAGRFPQDCREEVAAWTGTVQVVLSYSVLHYVFTEFSIFDFLDCSIALLAGGGEMLIGDIPNVSKRKRFFSSPAGIAFHKRFMQTDAPPEVNYNCVEAGEIDDAVVLALMMRAQGAGCDAYLYPQNPDLPMANRREDLYIRRP